MWLNTERVLYLGLLGQPQERCFGALTLYLSPQGTHRIRVGERDSDWQETQFSAVQPWCKHWLASDERMICMLLLEPESLNFAALPEYLRRAEGAVDAPMAFAQMHAALLQLRESTACRYASSGEFDRAFFGEALPAARLDIRVRKVVERLKGSPNDTLTAEEYARQACLSTSRFLHLFKAEVGAPFRSYRAWHRARHLLYLVKEQTSLTDLALDSGYPDATHFSHSIRRFAGLTPKSIFSGSRKLSLYVSDSRG